jgi:hypothetical protein
MGNTHLGETARRWVQRSTPAGVVNRLLALAWMELRHQIWLLAYLLVADGGCLDGDWHNGCRRVGLSGDRPPPLTARLPPCAARSPPCAAFLPGMELERCEQVWQLRLQVR